jgi:hypothetical protein
MNASEVSSRLVVSLSYRPEIRTPKTTSSIFVTWFYCIYLRTLIQTLDLSFVSVRRSMLKFSVELQTRPRKWTRIAAPPVTRDPLSLWYPVKGWGEDCRACIGNASSHTPQPAKTGYLKICKLFLLRECMYNRFLNTFLSLYIKTRMIGELSGFYITSCEIESEN